MTQYYKPAGYMKRVMNKHEIEKAIRHAAGPRDFNPAVRTIWDRVIDRPARGRATLEGRRNDQRGRISGHKYR